MRVSWREVLGLLIGLGMCYLVISYAMIYAPQLREMASEQSKGDPRRGGSTEEQTNTPAASNEDKKTVTVRVSAPRGQEFGVNYGTLLSSNTAEGTGSEDYEVEVITDPSAGDHVAATAWKTTGDSKELKVQLLDNGKVLQESTTTKDYGATGIRWNPNERPPETTMPVTEKTKEGTEEDTKLRYKTKEDTKLR